MKATCTLLSFFMCCLLAFAQPQKVDTSQINKDLKVAAEKVEKESVKSESLDKAIAEAESKKKKLDAKLNIIISQLHQKFNKPKEKQMLDNNQNAIKQDFDVVYGEEFQDYEVEIVERTWLGKMFHQLPFKFKKYKIIENEKVYID